MSGEFVPLANARHRSWADYYCYQSLNWNYCKLLWNIANVSSGGANAHYYTNLTLLCAAFIQASHVCHEVGFPDGARATTFLSHFHEHFNYAWTTPLCTVTAPNNASCADQRIREEAQAGSSMAVGVICKRSPGDVQPDLSLTGGASPNEGNLVATAAAAPPGGVRTEGLVGYVCGHMWDMADADVACRQLGFGLGARAAPTRSRFGRGSYMHAMDDVQCAGNETRLQDCPHNAVDNCGPSEVAGVVCHDGELN